MKKASIFSIYLRLKYSFFVFYKVKRPVKDFDRPLGKINLPSPSVILANSHPLQADSFLKEASPCPEKRVASCTPLEFP